MLHEQLRAKTQLYHENIEKKLDLMNPTLRLDRYRALIERLFGYYNPFEDILAQCLIGKCPELDFESRRKLQALKQDLTFLGLNDSQIASLPRCQKLPEPANAEEALACLYVIEGATLGGQFLAKHFRAHLQLEANRGCAFFSGYREMTGPRWRQFLHTLNSVSPTEESLGRLTAISIQTFVSLENWCCPKVL
ncbi:MAG: biliverdin-producing heme oxygenase [Bdellovibrionia bacterium]